MPKKVDRKLKKQAQKIASNKNSKKIAMKKPQKNSIKQVKKSVQKPIRKPVAKKAVAKKAIVKQITKKMIKPVAKHASKAIISKPVVIKQQPMEKTITQKAVVVPVSKPAVAQKALYRVGSYVVYPTHGVGRIMAEETQMIGEHELRMLVIAFEKDKMTLRVPVHRATAAGLRLVSTNDQMKKVFITLKSKSRTSRGMWSRRAQEYEAKINSGNITLIAEVVRDLHQNVDQSERSYSERMIYESALARLVGELAAAEATDHKTATDKLMKLLRAKVAAAAAEAKEAA